jgi:hypothetical protein
MYFKHNDPKQSRYSWHSLPEGRPSALRSTAFEDRSSVDSEDGTVITYPLMRSQRQRTRLLILLILVAYVITPLVDSVACTGCLKPQQIRENGTEGIYAGLTHLSPSPSIGLDQESGPSPVTDEAGFCAICAISLGALSRHSDNFAPASIFFEVKPTFITLSEVPGSIYRPPRNI